MAVPQTILPISGRVVPAINAHTRQSADSVATIGGSREIADTMITVPYPLTLATARRSIARERAAMRRRTALVDGACTAIRGGVV